MYALSKLSPDAASFVAGLSSSSSTSKELCNFAVAKAIANQLSLPSGSVKSPTASFNETHFTAVRATVSNLSDCICFDVQRVMTLIPIFWAVRYNCAYPAPVVFTGVENSESYFLGYGNTIAPADVKYIAQNSMALTNMLNAMTKVLSQLNDSGT
jgi:hypothetical protein